MARVKAAVQSTVWATVIVKVITAAIVIVIGNVRIEKGVRLRVRVGVKAFKVVRARAPCSAGPA